MKIIVTGGAGFIGSNFVIHMVKKYPEHEIVNLDLLTYAGNLENLTEVEKAPNYKFIRGDIADRKFVFDLFEQEKPDIIVNFAAESHVDRSITDPESFVRTNVMGTTTLLDACKEYGIKRFHQVSTDEVYGDLPLDRPDLFFTEETPLHTSSPYSSSKASADLFVMAYHRTFGIPVTISRCSNNYGPYQFPGEADSPDHQPCPGGRGAAGVRDGGECERLAPRVRPLRGHRPDPGEGPRGRGVQHRRPQ